MKTAGAVAVIVCSIFIAYQIMLRETKHIKAIENIIGFIVKIGREASFYRKPFAVIIKELSSENEFYELSFVRSFCESNASEGKVPELWRKSVAESEEELCAEEKNMLIKFGTELCECNSEMIDRIVESSKEYFEDRLEKAIENKRNKAKTKGVITVSAGIITVLVFI